MHIYFNQIINYNKNKVINRFNLIFPDTVRGLNICNFMVSITLLTWSEIK